MQNYKISEYIEVLKKNNQLVEIINCNQILEKEVVNISYSSNDVKEDTLFVCKGFGDNFKKEYLEDAIKKGAFAYVSEIDYNVEIPCILIKKSFVSLSIVSDLYFNHVSDKLNMIGITGTKGKSTTSYFVKYILDEYALANDKKDTAIISSIFTYDGKNTYKSKLTTPESLELNQNLYNAYESQLKNVVMEVSSQAVKLGRVYNITYDICAFLNISEDHIGPVEHPDFEDYFNSKLKIFEKSKVSCINLDADFSDKILQKAMDCNTKILTFSTKDKNADVYGYNIHKVGLETVFSVKYEYRNEEKSKEVVFDVTLSIPGLFNVENALAAIAIALSMNIEPQYIVSGLKKAKSAGRMEIYYSDDKKILSIVDYAHNKLSFEKIFETTRKEYPDKKIIAVFGCPGNKAQIRRKDLGEVAGKNASYIYITEDDPAFESVMQISKEVEKYVKEYTTNYEIIEDREEAIKKAVNKVLNSNEKYIILLLGKGNETSQKVGRKLAPYLGDSEVIKACINEYENKRSI